MCHARQFFEVDGRVNLHTAERIEIFNRHVQFFRKKLSRVGHDRGAAGKEKSLRGRAALLATVKLHRLIDLNVQLGHELPRDFGNGRLLRIIRLLIRTAQAHKALGNLDFFCVIKFQLRFGRKILRDDVRAQIDAARKNFTLFKKQQVARLCTDVQQHGAIFELRIIVAERVAERGGRSIAQQQFQFRLLSHTEESLDDFRLDGDQQHFQFTTRGRAEDLIIPYDFAQRKRHVLLRFVLDNLTDLGRVHRRQFDEL